MNGFPKHINNRFDLDYCSEHFPNETYEYLKDVLDHKDNWFPTKTLENVKDGIEDASHKVIEHKDNDGNVTEIVQFELMEDLNGTIYRLGFNSSDEANLYLKGIK